MWFLSQLPCSAALCFITTGLLTLWWDTETVQHTGPSLRLMWKGTVTPSATSRYFTQPCWVCCSSELFWEWLCFYTPLNSGNSWLWLSKKFASAFPLPYFWSFGVVIITMKPKQKWTWCLMYCLWMFAALICQDSMHACGWRWHAKLLRAQQTKQVTQPKQKLIKTSKSPGRIPRSALQALKCHS